MSRSTRRTAAVGVLATTALLLTGCSAFQGMVGGVEPERDVETGEITEAANASAFALRVGDCLDVAADAAGDVVEEVSEEEAAELEEVTSVPTVPCDQEHDSEIYAAHQLEGEEFPGEEAVMTSADELCFADFQPFVGTAYEDSTLDFTTYFPTAESWEYQDDREVLCVVVDPAGGVTGTLQGAQY